ncbi:MAG TPA: hypothetical protein VE592_05040, partial [Geminicoccaceae bacterium]|nr:hypothetical protein [Geminicoccaceae bacterium]
MGIALASSMVVEQIDIEGIAILETEDDAPVRGDLDRKEAFQFALERVEPEAGGIHVGHSRRGVQPAQDTPNLGGLVGSDAAAVALLEETLQPPMPEAP